MLGFRVSRFRVKLLIAGGFAGLLLLWVSMKWPCVFRSITGIPCISCGMSRAWLAALNLHFAEAFVYHPMFWSVPILALYAFFEGRLFQNRKWNDWVLGLILFGWVLCYAIRLVVYLGGGLTL